MFETGSEDKLKKPFGAIEYSSTRIENRTFLERLFSSSADYHVPYRPESEAWGWIWATEVLYLLLDQRVSRPTSVCTLVELFVIRDAMKCLPL